MFIGVTVVDGVTQIGKTNYNKRLLNYYTNHCTYIKFTH